MSGEPESYQKQLDSLMRQLLSQGEAVQTQIERAIEAVFGRDADLARQVVAGDEPIDQLDIEIERRAVKLLTDAMDDGVKLGHHSVRMIMTIVKVNNEFERIADCAVNIAEKIGAFASLESELPAKLRVMANSAVGIMQTTRTALAEWDADAARLVLSSDDATEAFKNAVLGDVESQLIQGEHTVDFAFALRTVTINLGRMTDHCTNVAEQVIYVSSGKIVRHLGDTWMEPEEPRAG